MHTQSLSAQSTHAVHCMCWLHVSKHALLIKGFHFVGEHSVQAESGMDEEEEPLESGKLVAVGEPQSCEHCPSELEEGELLEEGAVSSAPLSGHQDLLPQVSLLPKSYISQVLQPFVPM